jgi:hypothetical protein
MEIPCKVTTAPATGAASVLTSTRIVACGGSCENIGAKKVVISVSSVIAGLPLAMKEVRRHAAHLS